MGAGDAADAQPTTDSEEATEAIETNDGASEGGKQTWGDDEEAKGDTSGRENIERGDDNEEDIEEATVVGESEETEAAAATPTATADANAELQKQDMEARAREAEKCNELVEARAAKKKIITGKNAAGIDRNESMNSMNPNSALRDNLFSLLFFLGSCRLLVFRFLDTCVAPGFIQLSRCSALVFFVVSYFALPRWNRKYLNDVSRHRRISTYLYRTQRECCLSIDVPSGRDSVEIKNMCGCCSAEAATALDLADCSQGVLRSFSYVHRNEQGSKPKHAQS